MEFWVWKRPQWCSSVFMFLWWNQQSQRCIVTCSWSPTLAGYLGLEFRSWFPLQGFSPVSLNLGKNKKNPHEKIGISLEIFIRCLQCGIKYSCSWGIYSKDSFNYSRSPSQIEAEGRMYWFMEPKKTWMNLASG